MAAPVVWTVGHSNHEFDAFARLLAGERIEYVVDVRSSPYSRHAPQFNREHMADGLRPHGIGYLYLGDALGGRPSRDEHYDADGHADYARMAEEPAFEAAIERVLRGAADHRLALMCAEADPQHCHRRLLVTKVLTERGALVRHLMRDGIVVNEAEVVLPGTGPPALFGEAPRWRSVKAAAFTHPGSSATQAD